MKTLIKILFVFAAVSFFANVNEVQAQALLQITNPTCCPSVGICGADHPDIGPAHSQNWSGNGLINVNLYWDTTFPPGVADVFFWALTVTVEVPNAAWVEMYCYGDNTEPIGYYYNLTGHVTTAAVHIYDEEIPD